MLLNAHFRNDQILLEKTTTPKYRTFIKFIHFLTTVLILYSLLLVIFTNGWEQKPYSLIWNWIPDPLAFGMHAVFTGRFICLMLGGTLLINHIWTSPNFGATGNISNSPIFLSLPLHMLYMNNFVSFWSKEWAEVPSQTFPRKERRLNVWHSRTSLPGILKNN